MNLKDQRIIVLGGSSGIGLATAAAAVAEGAKVIICGRSEARLGAARDALGGNVETASLDVSREEAMKAFFEGLREVDHIYVAAGDVVVDPKLDLTTDQMRSSLETRFWGSVYAVKYGASRIRPGGSVTFTSGIAAARPIRGEAVTAASAAAIEALARTFALDYAPIRFNVICPGAIATPLLAAVLGDRHDAVVEAFSGMLPVKRIGRAEEVADAILFLMKSGYTTGTTLMINGGHHVM